MGLRFAFIISWCPIKSPARTAYFIIIIFKHVTIKLYKQQSFCASISAIKMHQLRLILNCHLKQTSTVAHKCHGKTFFSRQNISSSRQNISFSRQNISFSRQNISFSRQNFNFSRQNFNFSRQNFNFSRQNFNFSRQNFNFSRQNFNFSRQNFNFSRQNFLKTSNLIYIFTRLLPTRGATSYPGLVAN